MIGVRLRRGAMLAAALLAAGAAWAEDPAPVEGRTFYVRASSGDDASDGRSPARAWRSFRPLGDKVRAGDRVVVGPGLYRDSVHVTRGGRQDAPIVYAADPAGAATGDPPAPVLLVGSDPVDEGRFEPAGPAGVYRAHVPEFPVLGVVEVEGSQRRYEGVLEPVVGPPPLERVTATSASFYYDEASQVLTIHTSDAAPPKTHELELIRRHSAFYMPRRPWITVTGFHLRSFADAPILFRWSDHGAAIGNVAWGSRHGVRVRDSKHVLVEDNVLFRNENSGAYFVKDAHDGVARGNVAYENVKGLRWSSGSRDGQALENVLFDNTEAGLSLERASGSVARDNRLLANQETQLLLFEVRPSASDANCFTLGAGASSIAAWLGGERFTTLAAHQAATGLDVSSRVGGCGTPPVKVDVHDVQARARAVGVVLAP
jgi:hypothetical protein